MNLAILKKHVLIFGILFFCSEYLFAQNQHTVFNLKSSIQHPPAKGLWQAGPASNIKYPAVADTLFIEDFESGILPAGWSQTTNATDGGWKFGTNTQLSSSSWSIPSHTKMAASNDDACNCNKSVDFLITPSLDFSLQSSSFLSFSSYFLEETYQGNTEKAYVKVSTDGGISWDTIYSLAGSTTWQVHSVDLTPYAGQVNVLIAFHFYDGAGWLFGWAIDDVLVGVPPQFEPELVSISLSSEYSLIPLSQATNITFKGKVRNNGSDSIPNISGYVDVNAGSFLDTFWINNLAGFTLTDFNTTNPFIAATIGAHNVDIRIESDSIDDDTTNNQLSAPFNVSDTVYAWDNNIVNGSTAPGTPLSGFTNIIYGQLYEVTTEDTLTSITFKLQSGTIGQKVTAAVYFTDGNKLPAVEVPLSATDTLVISSTAQTWYTLPINGSPLILPPGNYLVGVKEASGSTPIGMTLSTTDFVPNSSYIFAEGFGWTKSENFWINDFIYLIRANFGKTVAPPVISIDSTTTIEATCNSTDGSFNLFASGGSGSLVYSVDTGITYQPVGIAFDSLPAGIYEVIIKDSNNCISAITVINNAGAAIISIDSIADVGCYGDSTGMIIVSASGGTFPYQFSIDGGATYQSVDTFSNLPVNDYIILVRDSNNCLNSSVISISEPAPLNTSMGGTDVSCNGANDGVAWVTITGGTLPYFYLWNDSLAQLIDTAYNLPPGTYIVGVSDANGCNIIDSIEIFEPTSLTGVITATDDSTGANVGTAKVVVSGGTPPYTWLWNTAPPQITDSIGGLAQGTYMVTVTDANGCQLIDSVTVNSPTGFIEIINGNGYIKLYPNPTTGKLHIIFDASVSQPSSLKVLNILGNIIVDITMTPRSMKNDYAIDLSDQPEGMYFIQIQTTNRVITKKIILNR